MTGASGSVYGMRLIEQLVLAGHEVSVVFTEAAARSPLSSSASSCRPRTPQVAAVSLATFLELPGAERLRVAYPDDLFDRDRERVAPHRRDDRCPCSMGFVALAWRTASRTTCPSAPPT